VKVLWEDIAASPEEFPLPDWLRTEVERRLAEYQSGPSATLTRGALWQQVNDRRG
jgi:putative addiction module component (TIGR02574 family)